MPLSVRCLAPVLVSALTACGGADAPPQPTVAPAESAGSSASAIAAPAATAASAASVATAGDPERDFLAACDMRKIRPTVARVVFEKACQDGHDRACTEFALMAARGAGGDIDDVAAFRVASIACTSRAQAAACAIAGVLILDRRAPEGAGEAMTYFDKGCSKRDYDSCRGQRDQQARSDPSHTSMSRLDRPRLGELSGTCTESGGLHLGK